MSAHRRQAEQSMPPAVTPASDRAGTGIAGLDDILSGGFLRKRLYLVEGNPGTGKTTIALQFLIEGARQGERGLYITLAETEDELRAGAASHGWALEGIDIFELVPPESLLDETQQQSLLYSSDLELGETTRLAFAEIARLSPSRIVFDSLSEIRLLAQSSLRYRRQILALKHYFARQGATVMLLDRPGVTGNNPFGYGGSGLSVSFSDADTASLQTTPETPGAVVMGNYQAIGQLSTFNGLSGNGTWSLFIADNEVGGGQAVLDGWSLDMVVVPESRPGLGIALVLCGALGLEAVRWRIRSRRCLAK